jgi:hypothetical protein
MKILFFISTQLFVCFFFMPFVHAQETCKVLLSSILSKYEGPCKKGKAEGEGKAEGADNYVGLFKDGYPNGKGIYQWKNGDTYDGNWIKGKMEGRGIRTFNRVGKTDSIVTGFWKKDHYVGKFEHPFVIHSQSNQISRIEITKYSNDKNNTITIELSNTSGGIPGLGASAMGAKASITEISVLNGAYLRLAGMMDGPKGTTQKLLDVDFPFKARYKIGSQEMVIEILEPGDWTINASLNN